MELAIAHKKTPIQRSEKWMKSCLQKAFSYVTVQENGETTELRNIYVQMKINQIGYFSHNVRSSSR